MTIVATKSRALPAERCLAVLIDGDHLRLFRLEGEHVDELRDAGGAAPAANGTSGDPAAAGPDAPAPARAAPGRDAPAPARAAPGPDAPAPARTAPGRRHRNGTDAALPDASAARHGSASCRAHDGPLPVVGACDHVHRAADRIARLARAEHIDRIVAGGAPECVAELRRILRARLGGDIEALPLPADAGALQVGEAARAARRAEPTSREEEVLGELIDAVGRGLAALGAAAVTEAVNEHRASLLIIPRAAGPSGAVCPACDVLFAAPAPAACPACGERPVPAPDFLARLARLVREHVGEVEQINGPAGEALRAYGGLAALLRYAFPGAGRTCPWSAVTEAAEPEHVGAHG